MMEIIGYKAFNHDLTNRYGQLFELNKTYHSVTPVTFGNNSQNFHMCSNIEDTFRYFDFSKPNTSVVCKVVGSGEYVKQEDEYYGYYDMYATENIRLTSIYSRNLLLEEFMHLPLYRQERFLETYKFTIDELIILKKTLLHILDYSSLKNHLDIYQNIDYETLKKI